MFRILHGTRKLYDVIFKTLMFDPEKYCGDQIRMSIGIDVFLSRKLFH